MPVNGIFIGAEAFFKKGIFLSGLNLSVIVILTESFFCFHTRNVQVEIKI